MPAAVELRFGDLTFGDAALGDLAPEPGGVDGGVDGGTELAPAVSVVLANGRTVSFRGIIDRVDRSIDGRRLVVYDYKTGSAWTYGAVATAIRDEGDLTARGTKLQLPIYALAARARFPEAEEVSSYYWFVGRKDLGKTIGAVVDRASRGPLPRGHRRGGRRHRGGAVPCQPGRRELELRAVDLRPLQLVRVRPHLPDLAGRGVGQAPHRRRSWRATATSPTRSPLHPSPNLSPNRTPDERRPPARPGRPLDGGRRRPPQPLRRGRRRHRQDHHARATHRAARRLGHLGDIRQLAAITFTEAAAAELRDRIRTALERAADPSAPSDLDLDERARCRRGRHPDRRGGDHHASRLRPADPRRASRGGPPAAGVRGRRGHPRRARVRPALGRLRRRAARRSRPHSRCCRSAPRSTCSCPASPRSPAP